LLEEYLMFAQMFGIAKEVSKEFEELYPKIIEENGYNYDFVDVLFISNFAYMGIARANSARMSSYSGGGGGFSAGGGRVRLIWRTAAVAAASVRLKIFNIIPLGADVFLNSLLNKSEPSPMFSLIPTPT